METEPDYLALDDAALLEQCDVHYYKSSGPGGQHRNKVSSAVRLRHCPTAVSAHGDDSRSQHDNKALAIKRLRMNLACQLRREIPRPVASLPPVVQECMFTPRGKKRNPADGSARPNTAQRDSSHTTQGDSSHVAPVKRLEVGPRDFRFWRVAAFVLDLLQSCEGRLSDAAAEIGITTGNLSSLLESDRHLLAAAQAVRKTFGLKPLS